MWILSPEQRGALISLANPENGLAVHGLRLKYVLAVNHLKDYSSASECWHSALSQATRSEAFRTHSANTLLSVQTAQYHKPNQVNVPIHTYARNNKKTFPWHCLYLQESILFHGADQENMTLCSALPDMHCPLMPPGGVVEQWSLSLSHLYCHFRI